MQLRLLESHHLLARSLVRSTNFFDDMGAVVGSILPLRLVVAAVFHVMWCRLSVLSSALVAHIPPMRAALTWRLHRDPTTDLLYWALCSHRYKSGDQVLHTAITQLQMTRSFYAASWRPVTACRLLYDKHGEA